MTRAHSLPLLKNTVKHELRYKWVYWADGNKKHPENEATK